jgi:AcrR family transcriptional regulator
MSSEAPATGTADHGPPRRGRPRTAGLDDRVLEATRASITEHGYSATTVDGIAARAAVSKGSIYRRWPAKGVLAYDACVAANDELPQVIDTGDIRADLLAIARLASGPPAGTVAAEVVPHILAEAATDPDLMEMLRVRFFLPRSDAIVRRVEVAVERGELVAGIDTQLVPAVLTGALQYTRRVRSRSLSDEELEHLVDMILGGHVPGRRPDAS